MVWWEDTFRYGLRVIWYICLVSRFEDTPIPQGVFVGVAESYFGLLPSMSGLRFVKSMVGLLPRSITTIGHLPSFEAWSKLCRSKKVLLSYLILSMDVNLHPPRMCVLLIGEWYLVHVKNEMK